ncbi:MAG: hypothetical protein H0W15_10995 [Gemmatimonadales bacterium]|nr:hypothetical protein [Gemmatimonadales bacterium]
MIQRLRRLDVGQMAKLMGVLNLMLGAVISIFIWLFGMLLPMGNDSGMFTFGAVMLIALPVIYGLFGLVFGAIVAGLYNLAAGWTGGLEFEFETRGERLDG